MDNGFQGLRRLPGAPDADMGFRAGLHSLEDLQSWHRPRNVTDGL